MLWFHYSMNCGFNAGKVMTTSAGHKMTATMSILLKEGKVCNSFVGGVGGSCAVRIAEASLAQLPQTRTTKNISQYY